MFTERIPTIPQTNSREIAVLRLVGRLGTIATSDIARVLFRDTTLSHARVALGRLVERHLLWRMEGPRAVAESATTPGWRYGRKSEQLYGLTNDGCTLLKELGAEPVDGTLDRLISRDRRAPAPSRTTLAVDMALSAWCASVIDHARRTYLLVGLTAHTRYAVPNKDACSQTIGAVLTLVFNPKAKETPRAAMDIPWLSGEVIDANWRVVRLAVEVDAGLASSEALCNVATMYKLLTEKKAYDLPLGGAPRPVVIVLYPNRFGKVATAWYDAWPGTPAVATTAKQATHDQHGALWGKYFTLKDDPIQPANLLDGLVSSTERWANLVMGWNVERRTLPPGKGNRKGRPKKQPI